MFAVKRTLVVWAGSLTLAALLCVTACTEDHPTAPSVSGLAFAKSAGEDPTVDETDPPGAPQDTTIDVFVLGSGFDGGSVASFTLDGVPTPKVKTNSTKFLGPKKLKANITIDLEAVIDLYDVEVMTRRGKKGIGVDLFRVFEKEKDTGKPIDWVWASGEFRDAPGDGVTNDSTGVPYEARFRPSPNGSLAMSAYHQDRTFCFYFPAESDLLRDGCYAAYSSTTGVNLLDMEVGSDTATSYAFLWDTEVQNGRKTETISWWLKFGTTDCQRNETRDSRVLVTHPNETTWVVRPPDDTDRKALVCRSPRKGEGKDRIREGEFYMPFLIDITSPPAGL